MCHTNSLYRSRSANNVVCSVQNSEDSSVRSGVTLPQRDGEEPCGEAVGGVKLCVCLLWLNGTVRLNRDVRQVFRALLMEYGLDDHEWPYLLPAVQANLNHTRVQSLAGRAPVEVFTALPASFALDAIVLPATIERSEHMVDLNDICGYVDRLRLSLHAIHREIADAKEAQRLRDMAAQKGRPVNFDVGDFVLWSRIDQRLPNRKLLSHWVGLFKVVAALPHSFEIENLVTTRKYEVHKSRLKFYADEDLDTTSELLELVSSQGMLLGVIEFRDHRFTEESRRWELLVSWVGLRNRCLHCYRMSRSRSVTTWLQLLGMTFFVIKSTSKVATLRCDQALEGNVAGLRLESSCGHHGAWTRSERELRANKLQRGEY